jgi:acyl carrier protein
MTDKSLLSKPLRSLEEIQDWLIAYMAELLEVNIDKVDISTPFERYGLDSSAMVVLSGDLQAWLGCELDPTLLYDYPTIQALVSYLVEFL